MLTHAFNLNHGGVILALLHSGFKLGDVFLRRLTVGFLIYRTDAVEVIVSDGGGVAHYKGAVLADYKGVNQRVFLFQGKNIRKVAYGKLAYHGNAVLHARNIQSYRCAHKHHLIARTVVSYGDAAFASLKCIQKYRGSGILQRIAVNSL